MSRKVEGNEVRTVGESRAHDSLVSKSIRV